MRKYMDAYLPILIFFLFATGLSIVIIVASFLLAKKSPDAEKNAPYECGFDPLKDSVKRFDVRFYLVAILFVVFDLEIAFLFPWSITLQALGWPGFVSMCLFLLTLTVGFIYEWKKGALEWT